MSEKELVIVTGAGGLIGFPLCERLSHEFKTVGFDREGPPHPPASVEWEPVDLASEESVRRAVDAVRRRHGTEVASVVHLAAYYDFSGRPSPLYDEVTVRGTGRLLEALEGMSVGEFVFSSTMLVHAPCQPGQRITEDWPLQPKWAYPASKVKAENLIRARRGGVPAVLLRIAGVYQDEGLSMPLSQQIRRIYEQSFTSELFPGDASHGQSFVHLDDVLDAIVAAVRRRGELPPETPLLIGEPVTLSYDELQRTFGLLIHGREWKTRRIPKAMAKAGAWMQGKAPFLEDPFIKPWMIDLADDHYALDVGRARSLLGWSPRRALGEALPSMVAALKADPSGWYRRNTLAPPGPADSRAKVPAGKPG